MLDPYKAWEAIAEQIETITARVKAKVEHPFRVGKRQFGFTLFALSNLWMARKALAILDGKVRPTAAIAT